MQTTAFEDATRLDLPQDIEGRDLSAALAIDGVAINHYRIPPGEGFPAGLHAHADQEEIFLVLEGVATFETLATHEQAERTTGDRAAGPGREVSVVAGEAIRFAPGEFQSGRNDGDDDLVALGLGAPRESEDVRVPLSCPTCGHESLRLDTGPARPTFECPACGMEHVPAPCPECGSENLHVTLDDVGEPIVACRQCGETYDEPPLEE